MPLDKKMKWPVLGQAVYYCYIISVGIEKNLFFYKLMLNFGDEILLRGGGYSDPGLFPFDYCIWNVP